MSEPRNFGTIEFVGKDIAVPSQRFDRIAVAGGHQLLLLSVVAEIHNVKRMRAILVGGASATITAAGVQVNQAGEPDWMAHSLGRIYATGDGYQVWTHKLGYGLVHALFMTRMPGFMKIVTPETLWQELNKERFTTPILQEWMPYIEKRLRERKMLEDAHCYNCQCGVLSAQTKHLDEIVEEGITRLEIRIPEPEAVRLQQASV